MHKLFLTMNKDKKILDFYTNYLLYELNINYYFIDFMFTKNQFMHISVLIFFII